MIHDWRGKWNEGDLTFLVVGLANFRARLPVPVDETWPRVREGELQTSQKLPNVALAEAIDVGKAGDIHPVDKFDVGRRLAAAAEHVAYGGKEPWAGPTFAGETIQGNSIRIKFDHTDGGLVIAASPWPADNAPSRPITLSGSPWRTRTRNGRGPTGRSTVTAWSSRAMTCPRRWRCGLPGLTTRR